VVALGLGTGQRDLVLDAERLVLRRLAPADVTPAYVQGLNDPAVNRYLEVRHSRPTLDTVRAYVGANLASATALLFGLLLKAGGRLIGTVRLHDVSGFHFSAAIGVCLFVKECWGKGYGVEAVRRVTQFGFEELGLHYIEAGSYEENRASLALFARAGFEIHEVVRNKYRLGDRFVPVVRMGLVNPHFDEGRLKNR
jgi:RimJ/RimL family protein N-acetyltransferase